MPMRLPSDPREAIVYLRGYYDAKADYEVQLEEKTGKWIAMSDADGVYWICSECGEEIPRISHYDPQFDLFPRLESINKTNYCPNCGAKMK